MSKLTPLPEAYDGWLQALKAKIRQAQLSARLAVNHELISLYWRIGHDILERQRRQGWGAKVIDRLAADLRAAFPEIRGFSARNLKYRRAFTEAWPEESIVQQLAAQIPWFHNCTLLDKVSEPAARLVRAPDHRTWLEPPCPGSSDRKPALPSPG